MNGSTESARPIASGSGTPAGGPRASQAVVSLSRDEAEIVRRVFASLEALGQRHVVAKLRPDEYALLVRITEALDER